MRRLVTLLCVTLVVLPLTPSVAPAAESGVAVRWRPCHSRIGPDFECAEVRVPLDYDHPGGRQISLSLVRLPATDPGSKIGSIFLNPGGPGGSGVAFVLGAGPILFNDEVRAHFDLIGFDPRGINRSSPLLCFRSLDRAFRLFPPFFFPVTREEELLAARLDIALNSACQRRAGEIIDHMATADVARDLDLLRQAVGDDQLTYVGYSYGSFLGVTYANMFPDRVRALVVDGVLDPIAWTTGRGDEAATQPFSSRIRSDAGAQATLNEFFRLCDEAEPGACAFAGQAAARFAALAKQLRAAPIEIIFPPTGQSFPFTYADLIGISLFAMYSSPSWPSLAEFLADIEAAARPASLGKALQAIESQTGLAFRRRPGGEYPNFIEGFPGVACSDSDNPVGRAYWSVAGAEADVQFGYFGRTWTWASSPCAAWEGFDADRYLGPFDRQTANPVLVVGNRFDPATRYQGALTVHDLLPNSSLLTVEGWGHTSLFLSLCADRVVSRYLIDGTAPTQGTTCTQDVGPFQAAPSTRRGDRLLERLAARARVMSEMAFLPER